MTYVAKGIERECQRIRELASGEQQTGSHALNIHSLLKGAALAGADCAELAELTVKAKKIYVDAVCAMVPSDPKDPWTERDATRRWERNEGGGTARLVPHVPDRLA
jgi:hypothetical protein